MVKCIFTVVFRPDLEEGAALHHWRNPHAALIKALPGVVRFTQNVVTETMVGGWDGVAEIWFESRSAYDAALTTVEWHTVLADGPNFMQVSALSAAVVEEFVVVGDSRQ
ncbi:MAG: hypothetical protein JWQ19_2677 [Subtercola sp.]|nr:hypothetical protein [Subtercola sp.]